MKKTENEMPNVCEKRWLTKKELASYLGFSTRFVDQSIRPYLREYRPNQHGGRKILFSRDEVDAFIRASAL